MAQEIIIPRLGWSMEEGTFVAWLKSEGDFVKRGDALFELEGEKATQEIEAVDEGVLRIPLSGPKPGSVHKVGAIIGYLVGAVSVGRCRDGQYIRLHRNIIIHLTSGTLSFCTKFFW